MLCSRIRNENQFFARPCQWLHRHSNMSALVTLRRFVSQIDRALLDDRPELADDGLTHEFNSLRVGVSHDIVSIHQQNATRQGLHHSRQALKDHLFLSQLPHQLRPALMQFLSEALDTLAQIQITGVQLLGGAIQRQIHFWRRDGGLLGGLHAIFARSTENSAIYQQKACRFYF